MMTSLGQIADWLNADLMGDPQCMITGAGSLDQAAEGQITFAEKGAALKHVGETKASAVIVPRGFSHPPVNLIGVDFPRLAFAMVLERLYPRPQPVARIHPLAVIGEHCILGEDVCLAAGVVLGNHVVLGDRVSLHPHVVVGDHAVIGDDTLVYPNVSIMQGCLIGRRVILHAGSVIGSDGFGFVFDRDHHRKMPQIGIVQIDDDVEIGANTTIDRGTLGKTWIKTGVKTDNLVHIAHNVTIGEHSVIIAQVGFAGSTTTGRFGVFAGQAGIGGHLTLGDQVTIGPQCAVAQSVPDKQIVSSTTLAMPHRTWLRLQKVLPGLPELFKKVQRLEKLLGPPKKGK
jgi:UDP-3-O-[3-hydroxymyristoyl] glucosamine N-acyltransferase